MDHVMHVISWIGFPTLLAMLAFLYKRVRALDCGIQSVLRDRLRHLYKSYSKKGYVSLDDKEDWEYMYQQYHALGKNGVMDSTREKMLALPMEKKED